MASEESHPSSYTNVQQGKQRFDSSFLDKVSSLKSQEDSDSPQLQKRLKAKLNPGGTSLSIFRKYISCSEATGEIDVSQIFSFACFNEWTLARKIPPKNPAQSFRRTLTAHIRGTDERQPFFADEEAAILEHIRKPDPFKYTFGITGHNIGQKGFGGVGYHEQHPGKDKKSLLARINEKKRESKVLRQSSSLKKQQRTEINQTQVHSHFADFEVHETHGIRLGPTGMNIYTGNGVDVNNLNGLYNRLCNNNANLVAQQHQHDFDGKGFDKFVSISDEEFQNHQELHEQVPQIVPDIARLPVDQVPKPGLVLVSHKNSTWNSLVGGANYLLNLIHSCDGDGNECSSEDTKSVDYPSEDTISVEYSSEDTKSVEDTTEVANKTRRENTKTKRKRKLTTTSLNSLIAIVNEQSYDGEQFRRHVVPFLNQFDETQLRTIQKRFEELHLEFFGPKVISSFIAGFRSNDARYSREFIIPENVGFAPGKYIGTLFVDQNTFLVVDLNRFARTFVPESILRSKIGKGKNQVSMHYARLLNMFYYPLIATAKPGDKFWFRQTIHDPYGQPIWLLTLVTVISDALVRWDAQVIDHISPLIPQDNIRFLSY
eukprot:CAMPEP_0204863808 /NCGR_PEP_ID=MMETSP1348-20121228/3584_1 /ASSEMBLY_ACC=CAM_ASM_000700 /TAXON_ID=215587 /ORGANISM="Aplanochytrium stocchinoi, Strain GSBS06" /LENGTH=599 /DNA_ID=CAMNT_0052014235 /DNA_START=62 /DNA_END=1861 /DNA_ORIENTATION=+